MQDVHTQNTLQIMCYVRKRKLASLSCVSVNDILIKIFLPESLPEILTEKRTPYKNISNLRILERSSLLSPKHLLTLSRKISYQTLFLFRKFLERDVSKLLLNSLNLLIARREVTKPHYAIPLSLM